MLLKIKLVGDQEMMIVTTYVERQHGGIIYFDDEEACDGERHTSFYHIKYDHIIRVEAMRSQDELAENESPVSDYEEVLGNKFIKYDEVQHNIQKKIEMGNH